MTPPDILGHILVGLAIMIIGFLGWLWKQSIYGKFSEMEKAIADVEFRLTNEARDAKAQAQTDVKEAKHLASEGLAEIKDTVHKEISIIREAYVPILLCRSERDSCQIRLLERMDAINKALGDKLDMVIERQITMYSRFDGHINGHQHGTDKW